MLCYCFDKNLHLLQDVDSTYLYKVALEDKIAGILKELNFLKSFNEEVH